MFDVSWSRDTLTCKMSETPKVDKLMRPLELACEIEVKLGVVPSKATGEALRDGLKSELNKMAKERSGRFLAQLTKEVDAVVAMARTEGTEQAKKSGVLKNLESEQKALWTNWVTRIAPQMADDCLKKIVKQAREPEIKDLQLKKVKSAGRVVAVPVLAFAAAVASAATGNVAGVASALLKMGSAAMKATDDLNSALNALDTSQSGSKTDLVATAKALKALEVRCDTIDKHRASSEKAIAALTAEQRDLARGLAKVQDGDAKAAAALKKTVAANAAAIKALNKSWPDTGALRASIEVMKTELRSMQSALNLLGSEADKSLRNARDLADGSKEILSILSKLT